MSSDRAPLVPPDVDLRDFPFMPLDVQRLRSSDLAALERPEACWAAVLLWSASWHQVPAASLPDDDRVLANLAGYGRDLKAWRRVREGALRGFVKAADGRLYHPVTAEKALEAWLEKLAQRVSGREGNAKRWGLPFDRTVLDAAMADARSRLAALNPQSRALSKKRTAGIPAASPPDSRQESPPDSHQDRKGQGQGQGIEPPTPLSGDAAPDDARIEVSKSSAKREARAAAGRVIAYLNEKAGTRFQAVEANVRLAAARIMYDGAQEADLRAVVDFKVALAERGEFDRKYLRPATLFDAEKFAQYIGQINACAPKAQRTEPVAIYAEYDAGKRRHVSDYPPGDTDAMARRALAEYGSTPWMQSARNLVMRINGSELRFSIEEMRRAAH